MEAAVLFFKLVEKMYGGKNGNAFELLKLIFIHPIVRPKTLVEELKVSPATANSLLKNFEKAGILVERSGNQRNRIYAFKAYMNLLTDVKDIKTK